MLEDIYNLNYTPLILSLKLALTTTTILFVFSLPLAWFLSQTKSKIKPLIEALTALPIVLPPSVLGFYILILLSPDSPVGKFLVETFNIELLFSWSGIVIASIFYSLPFMVQPLQNGFESLNREMERN